MDAFKTILTIISLCALAATYKTDTAKANKAYLLLGFLLMSFGTAAIVSSNDKKAMKALKEILKRIKPQVE